MSSSDKPEQPKRNRKSKPTTKARNAKQKLKDRYAHAREDAQLAGLIPTTPEEALKDERVPPSAQTEQPLPHLTSEAIRRGWAVPEERKPGLIDELIAIVENHDLPEKVRVSAFNALRQADDSQHERDNPTGKNARPLDPLGAGTTIINGNVVQNNLQANRSAADVVREMVMNGQLGCLEAVRVSAIPSTPSEQGHVREVAASSPFEGDQQQAGESLENAQQQNGDQRTFSTW